VSPNINIDAQGFLKMLVAQAQNQDPTNPMDSNQYVSQLAAISSVQQSVRANTLLTKISNDVSIAQAGTLIGLTATSPDGAITGVIQSVSSSSGSSIATLVGGVQISLEDGVQLSRE
jgi:flagellar basal-body rod modification protein FlgD